MGCRQNYKWSRGAVNESVGLLFDAPPGAKKIQPHKKITGHESFLVLINHWSVGTGTEKWRTGCGIFFPFSPSNWHPHNWLSNRGVQTKVQTSCTESVRYRWVPILSYGKVPCRSPGHLGPHWIFTTIFKLQASSLVFETSFSGDHSLPIAIPRVRDAFFGSRYIS